MSSYQTIDLDAPYHDPTSPLYQHSLRASRTTDTATTMTQSSQLASSDYFSHRSRSFLSAQTNFGEKFHVSPSPNAIYTTPQRGRTASRAVGYSQPILQVVPNERPRIPRTRTIVRLLLLCTLVGLATLGWRCESMGCKGRGGGALVGDYVGGGSVIQGVDLSRIWEKPSWGGERQDGWTEEGSSTLDAFRHFNAKGELVGMDEGVEWDDEDGDFGYVGWDESMGSEGADGEEVWDDGSKTLVEECSQGEGEEQQERSRAPEVVQEQGATAAEEKPEESYEAYNPPSAEAIVGLVGETTGPAERAVESIAAGAVAPQNAESDMQSLTQKDDGPIGESASLTHGLSSGIKELEGSWLGAVEGLL